MSEDDQRPDRVILYVQKGCTFSASLRRDLRRRGLPVELVDIHESPAGAAVVRAATGGAEVTPVVAIGDVRLVNPSGRDVVGVVRATAAHLLPPEGVETPGGWWRRAWSRLGEMR